MRDMPKNGGTKWAQLLDILLPRFAHCTLFKTKVIMVPLLMKNVKWMRIEETISLVEYIYISASLVAVIVPYTRKQGSQNKHMLDAI